MMSNLFLPTGLPPLFRGGPTLTPRSGLDVFIDTNTGLLQTDRGVSVFDDASKVKRFGGAFHIVAIPEGLIIRQRGRDSGHFEIMPSEPMTFERYVELLQQVVLRSVDEEWERKGV